MSNITVYLCKKVARSSFKVKVTVGFHVIGIAEGRGDVTGSTWEHTFLVVSKRGRGY